VWRFLKRLKIDLPNDAVIPLLGVYLKEGTPGCRAICTLMFMAALFTIAKLWKQPRCTMTDDWIKTMWYIYTMEFHSP
jgi:hypothetical protein